MAEEDDYRLEVLIALRKIERLDKDEFSEEERGEAQEIYEQRRQEELEAEALAVRRQRDVIDRSEWPDKTDWFMLQAEEAEGETVEAGEAGLEEQSAEQQPEAAAAEGDST